VSGDDDQQHGAPIIGMAGTSPAMTKQNRFVIAGLVPAISITTARCADHHDGRDRHRQSAGTGMTAERRSI
jgi:hypothetical protein